MDFLSLLSPFLSGIFQPIKDYVAYKSAEVAANRDLTLAQIAAQKEALVAQTQADSSQLSSRLDSTTKEFKQNTFWLLCVPIVFSILLPSKAEVMWHNFSLIPDFFQWLFLSVYSSIWGIPIVKGGYGAITQLIQARNDNAIEKIKAINEAAVAASLRSSLFKHGMTDAQWQAIQSAIKAGEDSNTGSSTDVS